MRRTGNVERHLLHLVLRHSGREREGEELLPGVGALIGEKSLFGLVAELED